MEIIDTNWETSEDIRLRIQLGLDSLSIGHAQPLIDVVDEVIGSEHQEVRNLFAQVLGWHVERQSCSSVSAF